MLRRFRAAYDFQAEDEASEMSVVAGEQLVQAAGEDGIVGTADDSKDGWMLMERVADPGRNGYVPVAYLLEEPLEAAAAAVKSPPPPPLRTGKTPPGAPRSLDDPRLSQYMHSLEPAHRLTPPRTSPAAQDSDDEDAGAAQQARPASPLAAAAGPPDEDADIDSLALAKFAQAGDYDNLLAEYESSYDDLRSARKSRAARLVGLCEAVAESSGDAAKRADDVADRLGELLSTISTELTRAHSAADEATASYERFGEAE